MSEKTMQSIRRAEERLAALIRKNTLEDIESGAVNTVSLSEIVGTRAANSLAEAGFGHLGAVLQTPRMTILRVKDVGTTARVNLDAYLVKAGYTWLA